MKKKKKWMHDFAFPFSFDLNETDEIVLTKKEY